MQKIAVAGVVSPAGLGDALQYYVLIKFLNDSLPEADVTFICPDLEKEISVFKDLKLNARLLSLFLSSASDMLFNYSQAQVNNVNTTLAHAANRVIKWISIISKTSRVINVSPFFARRLFSFSAGIFGGHTIGGDLNYYISQYKTLRSIVNGPIITSPISISQIALEHHGQTSSILKRLKSSLQKFDIIFVRGPHSLRILRDRLNIDEKKVVMALDSGFGMSLIHPDMVHSSSKALKKEPRIVIVPRKDYFYDGKKDLYKSYLKALVDFISWLARNYDAELFLASQTVRHDRMSDNSAIDDVVRLLEKRNSSRCLNGLKIVRPNNLIDAHRLYGSADLVITGRMHGGIMALSTGIPAIFTLPSAQVKVLDILSFLGLDTDFFLIDTFDVNELRAEKLIDKTETVIEKLEYYKKIVEFAVNRAQPTLKLPVRILAELLR